MPSRRSFARRLLCLAAVGAAIAAEGTLNATCAQDVAMTVADRSPRFFVAASPKPVLLNASRTPVLRQRISIDFKNVRLGDALEFISREAGLRLMYSWTVVPVDRPVTLKAEGITVAGALSEVLFDAGVDVLFEQDGQAAIVKRPPPPAVGTITGIVTEAKTGGPVPQAQVRVAGTSLVRTTADDGRYTLVGVPAGQRTVTVRRLGYDPMTQDVTVRDNQSATLDFALVAATTRLAEIVSTATGGQRRVEMGNAVATINSDSLLQIAPIMSFGDLLQGRSPGVLSLQESGYGGASGRIRIRGLNSLNVSNDPIVVVDGVRVEAGAGTGGASAALNADAGGRTGRLADFDPDEIASVEIVKGPSAATLYGTDAANGVIVITTKRGQVGRARWSAFTEQGLQTQGLDLTDAFPGAYYAFGRSTLDDSPQRCTLLQRAEGSCVVDSLRFFNAFTDPETRPLKAGWRHQYGLQLSGGTTGGTTYFLSGNYEQETGPAYMPVIDQEIIRTTQGRDVPDWQVRPNAVKRVNLRANVTAPLGQRGNFTVATGFVSNQARQPVQGLPRGQVGYRNENDGWDDFGGIFNLRPAYNFPWRGQDVVRRFMGSLATTYSARDWLALRGTMGADLSTDAYSDLLRRGEGPYIGILSSINTGSLRANELNIARYSLDLGATATRNLSEAWSSRTSVGLQYNRRSQRGVTARASDLPIGGETSAGGTVCAFCYREVTLTTAVAGGYVEEMLGLNDRLFVTGALRFDGGSTFGRDFSVATYPKAHLSWVLTNGDVGPRLPGVSALRLRAAYGAAGVQPGPTDALERVEVRTGYSLDGSGTAPGGVLIAGNADLKPERSTELDAGLDLELWQSRVRLEFTGYHRATKDALIRRLNAASVGGERIENLGSVQNQGLELVLSADLVQNRILAAGFTLTGGLNENELRKLGEGVLVSSPADEFTRNEEGYPLYGLWGYTVESFADANGNGIIEPTEVVMTGPNSHFIGATVPTREATISPYVKLFGERLHLSTLLQYRGGFYRYNGPNWEPCFSGACRAMSDPAAPLEDQARAVAYTVFGRIGPTIADGSYLRLRELSLGFTAPPAVSRLLRAQAGQLTLAGRNLAALWKASSLPMETAEFSHDGQSPFATPGTPGSTTYWMLRVHLTY